MLKYSEPHHVTDSQRGEFLEFALELAAQAGQVILPFFRTELAVENKLSDGRFDPVTEADRGAEIVIRSGIEKMFPEHGVLGEEFGFSQGNGLTWVIDPIDGTRAFMSGMLHWGVLLALFDGQRPILGVMHQPFTDEFFAGDCRNAHYHCGDVSRPLCVRSCVGLEDAVLTTTSPRYFAMQERDAFAQLEKKAKVTRYGGDCYIYAMLAMGQVDLATDSNLNPYDIQALIPIIQGAGGVVTAADGGDASMGGFVIAAGSPEVHRQALAVVKESLES
ncbi:MAG: histidinol-phosphatase [Pseudomonadales bacterium]|jgi:myo-inositol-1(or 4)-monophosphatase